MTPTHCSQCGTALMEAAITHEVIVGEELFQIEEVPALVCRECGEEWIEEEVKATIEKIILEGAREGAKEGTKDGAAKKPH